MAPANALRFWLGCYLSWSFSYAILLKSKAFRKNVDWQFLLMQDDICLPTTPSLQRVLFVPLQREMAIVDKWENACFSVEWSAWGWEGENVSSSLYSITISYMYVYVLYKKHFHSQPANKYILKFKLQYDNCLWIFFFVNWLVLSYRECRRRMKNSNMLRLCWWHG